MTATRKIVVKPSCGDVYRDIGIELSLTDRAKIDIAAEITLTIGKLNITQTEAASLMGTDQAKVSSIMRGRVSGFTLDRLIGFLLALGKDVEMNITPISRSRRLGRFMIHSGKRASSKVILSKSKRTSAAA